MIYDDLLRPRAICRRVSEGQYVVGSVVKGGAFCRGDNLSCSPRRQAKNFVIAKSRDKIYNLAFINKLQF